MTVLDEIVRTPDGDDGPLFLAPPTGTIHTHSREGFSRTLNKLNSLLIKTPQQRIEEDFGNRLLESAVNRVQSLHNAQHIRQLVNSMRSDSEAIEAAKERWRNARVKDWNLGELMPLLQSQIEALSNAREAHGRIVLNLRTDEIANETTYDTRRQDLRNWNRGMQTYARETKNIFGADFTNPYTMQIDDDIRALEFCRMCIWDPYDTTTAPPEDAAEMAKLRHALEEITNRQWDSASTACQRIITDTSRSKYAETCAFVLLGMIETQDNESRANWTIQCIYQLHDFRFGGPRETAHFRVQWDAEMAALHRDAEKSLYGLEHSSAVASSAILRLEMQGIIRRPGIPPVGINPRSTAYNSAPAPAFNPNASSFQPGNAFHNPAPVEGGSSGGNASTADQAPGARQQIDPNEPLPDMTGWSRRKRRAYTRGVQRVLRRADAGKAPAEQQRPPVDSNESSPDMTGWGRSRRRTYKRRRERRLAEASRLAETQSEHSAGQAASSSKAAASGT